MARITLRWRSTLGQFWEMQKETLGNADHAARSSFERALKIFEGFFGQDHPEVAKTLTSLGNAEGSLGNATHAEGAP